MTTKFLSQAVEPVGESIQRQQNSRQRILVVDDDPLIRQINTEVLAYAGYQVETAEDGADAWNALQLNGYDLLITDHDMPKLSGLELLQKLHAARMALPVIMATGTLPKAELARRPWLKIDVALLKPYTFDELLETVKTVLYANVLASQEIAPPPNWPSQPLAGHLQF
jgi:DNA-binding response OmpR family regulator